MNNLHFVFCSSHLSQGTYNDGITDDCMPIYEDGECWDPVNSATSLYWLQTMIWMSIGIEVIVDFGGFVNNHHLNFQGDLILLGEKK